MSRDRRGADADRRRSGPQYPECRTWSVRASPERLLREVAFSLALSRSRIRPQLWGGDSSGGPGLLGVEPWKRCAVELS